MEEEDIFDNSHLPIAEAVVSDPSPLASKHNPKSSWLKTAGDSTSVPRDIERGYETYTHLSHGLHKSLATFDNLLQHMSRKIEEAQMQPSEYVMGLQPHDDFVKQKIEAFKKLFPGIVNRLLFGVGAQHRAKQDAPLNSFQKMFRADPVTVRKTYVNLVRLLLKKLRDAKLWEIRYPKDGQQLVGNRSTEKAWFRDKIIQLAIAPTVVNGRHMWDPLTYDDFLVSFEA